jgi:glycosyltransferase involved in cell wall biosynthesis
VLLVTELWGRDGGVAAHVKASAELLVERGVDVHVLTAGVEAGEQPRGVVMHVAPELFNARAPLDARLADVMSCHPSVIHFHRQADPQIISHMRTIAPVVRSVHGYAACTAGVHFFAPGQECTRAHGPGCAFNLTVRGCAHTRRLQSFPARYRQVTQGLAGLRLTDLVISYSSAVDRHLAENGLTRRVVVPLFTTMAAHTGSGHTIRRRVVFAGRIAGPKGPGVLIQAAREVDAEFVLCGEGRQLELIQGLARRLGVHERVRFTGWLDPESLARELGEASVVAMPSRWPEPFGLVGIEALSCGRPVVASATGGILDWLQDGVNGLSVRPGDPHDLARALEQLLSDPERQRTMGAAGRNMVAARFSPERHLDGLLDAYRTARSSWLSARDATLTLQV